MARRPSDLLTGAELELMKSLWSLGSGSVRDVMAVGSDARAYTSVATILRVMERKGYLSSEARGRTMVFHPTVTRDAYETRSLRSLARSLFGGEPSAMVARLVDDDSLDDAEVAAIRRVVEARFGDGDG